MKALLLNHPGLPDTLYVSEVPEPYPAGGEVWVKVHAAGLNPADYQFAQRDFPKWHYPHILGLDVAGVIDMLGANATEWQVGDPVFYHGDLSKPGGFAEWTIAPAHAIAPLPKGLSFNEGILVRDRTISPMLQDVIRLGEIPDGLKRLAQRHIRGKIVAQIQP